MSIAINVCTEIDTSYTKWDNHPTTSQCQPGLRPHRPCRQVASNFRLSTCSSASSSSCIPAILICAPYRTHGMISCSEHSHNPSVIPMPIAMVLLIISSWQMHKPCCFNPLVLRSNNFFSTTGAYSMCKWVTLWHSKTAIETAHWDHLFSQSKKCFPQLCHFFQS